jgi:hypothetical protein
MLERLGASLTYVIPAVTTIIAVWLGYRAALAQGRKEKQLEFVERQISEFYSPLVGCVNRVRAKANLSAEISRAADTAWRQIADRAPRDWVDHEERFQPFKSLIDYGNRELREQVIPTYDKMEQIFSDNYWLAEPETRQWYPELIKFLDIWHRFLDRSIPVEVIEEVKHGEDRLLPFYDHLPKELDRLRNKLIEGKA